ncbi:MAG: DUF4296 domain-containing protein [Bergeyella sp.]
MRKLIVFFVFLGLVSCSQIVERPEHLISEKKMAEAVAELAISDQLMIVDSGININDQTAAVFNKLKIKPKDFSESYRYYIATGKIEKIFDRAQEIIIEKDPGAKKYIEKKEKEKPDYLSK